MTSLFYLSFYDLNAAKTHSIYIGGYFQDGVFVFVFILISKCVLTISLSESAMCKEVSHFETRSPFKDHRVATVSTSTLF